MKLFHFHLRDPMENPKTLIARLKEGEISYTFYQGHSSSGTPLALSNLQCPLPVDKAHPDETREGFAERVKGLINNNSVCRVVNEVSAQVEF